MPIVDVMHKNTVRVSLTPICAIGFAFKLMRTALWAALHQEQVRLTVENDGTGVPCGMGRA